MLLCGEVTSCELVELILSLVEVAEANPEEAPSDEREDTHGTVVPYEKRVSGEGDKCLAERTGEGAREQEDAHNQRAHVLGRLRERVLQAGDGREDLRDREKDIRACLDPDIEIGRERITICVHACRCLVPARVGLVDVMLHDGGPDHREGPEEESPGDLLQRREVDPDAAHCRVQEEVTDRDEYDERKGVEVGQDIVREAMRRHRRCLGRQVVVDLVVREPVDRVVDEDRAGFEATGHFIDPLVVPDHPAGTTSGLLLGLVVARLCGLPEVRSSPVLPQCPRVERPPSVKGNAPNAKSCREDGSGRGRTDVVVAADEKHDRA